MTAPDHMHEPFKINLHQRGHPQMMEWMPLPTASQCAKLAIARIDKEERSIHVRG